MLGIPELIIFIEEKVEREEDASHVFVGQAILLIVEMERYGMRLCSFGFYLKHKKLHWDSF